MKRFQMSAAVTLVLAGLFAAGAVLAAKGKDAPEKITIGDCKDKRAAVAFDHKEHVNDAKIECTKCHHTVTGLKAGADLEVPKCASCHLNPKDAKAQSCKEMSPAKNPFHVLCLGCHKAKKDAKAPTKCDACHQKT